MTLTMDEFDAKYDAYESLIDFLSHNCLITPFYPNESEIQRMAEDLDKYVDYIIFLLATNPEGETEYQKKSIISLNNLIKGIMVD